MFIITKSIDYIKLQYYRYTLATGVSMLDTEEVALLHTIMFLTSYFVLTQGFRFIMFLISLFVRS